MTRLALLAAFVSMPAGAFSVGTIATAGCHERLTVDAVRAAGLRTSPATPDDVVLQANLPFVVKEPLDRSTLSLLIGVRHPDFRGAPANDFRALAAVHLAPDRQHEHCLRGPHDDGAVGDVSALGSCRAFIERQVTVALSAGPEDTEAVVVPLITGPRLVMLDRRSFHLAQALHAIQDGYAHTVRDEGNRRVRGVLNYLEPIIGWDYALARDGHAHVSALDDCGGSTLEPRALAAVDASSALLRAVLGTEGATVSAAMAVVEPHFAYQPACTDGAAWCGDAQALLEASLPAPGCSTTGLGPSGWLLVVAAGRLAHRRRRARAGALHRPGAGWRAAALVTALGAAIGLAEEPRQDRSVRVAWVGFAGASAERGGAVVGAGIRFTFTGPLGLGADLEWNPWFDVLAGKASGGVVNALGVAQWAWLRGPDVELKSSLSAGLSALAHEAVGARVGSVGPALGVAPVMAVVRGPGALWFEVRPEALLVIPSLRGIPLLYHQYRLVFAVRFPAG